MSRPIIEVRNLSKRYQLGAIGATSLREEASRLWDRLRGIPHADTKEFWALRDVSFDVQPGEVVGVIGRNGAGKSTLLKILSRITEPTSGTAKLRGRVASLLEVGTGFHPELTGRENIFLNGAILGMSRAEVRKKFDEIVAFAEVEQFIDTPVKRYSSGMYVRLAFAVAAHLEPEILIVDEVLAVGDAQFQKKCLGKMEEVSRSHGRTILFVSHNLEAIEHLCTTAIYFEHGRLVGAGTPGDMLAAYLNHSREQAAKPAGGALCDGLYLDKIELAPNPVAACEPLDFELALRTTHAVTLLELHLFFNNQFGHRVAIIDLRAETGQQTCEANQIVHFRGRIEKVTLVAGHYSVGFALRTGGFHEPYFDQFQLTIGAQTTRSALPPYAAQWQGTTLLNYRFTSDSTPTG
jgi:lipopolysaccharide transport system ATP-binding protein